MEEQEKKLYELFSQKERLVSEEPAVAAAFSPDPDKLKEGERRARALFSEGPDAQLRSERRGDLGTRRFPEIQGVLSLFCAGLEKHRDLATEVGADPKTIERLARVDMALGRLAWAAELILGGGENGELITAAALQATCQGLIQQAQSPDSRATPAQRLALTAAFTEPTRLEQQRRDREAQARAISDKTAAPLQAQITTAQEGAAMSRVIEAYLDHVRHVRRGA